MTIARAPQFMVVVLLLLLTSLPVDAAPAKEAAAEQAARRWLALAALPGIALLLVRDGPTAQWGCYHYGIQELLKRGHALLQGLQRRRCRTAAPLGHADGGALGA